MEHRSMRPIPPRAWWESDRVFGWLAAFCGIILVGFFIRPRPRPMHYPSRVSRVRVPHSPTPHPCPVQIVSHHDPSASVWQRGTEKVQFSERFDGIVPSSMFRSEVGIRTSRSCVESRDRPVRLLIRQPILRWSERYSAHEWEEIVASPKSRLTLVVRVLPAARYEHVGFTRLFVAWTVISSEELPLGRQPERIFRTSIPESAIPPLSVLALPRCDERSRF